MLIKELEVHDYPPSRRLSNGEGRRKVGLRSYDFHGVRAFLRMEKYMTRSAQVAAGLLLWSAMALPTVQAQQYVISTYAGAAPPATPARGVDVSIAYAWGVAADARGNAYFASSDLNCVFKLDRAGMLTRVAGNARPGFSGDGGPATSAQLQGPGGVAVDRAGNLFISDSGNYRIRRVSPSGIITTVAGTGNPRLLR
jgi:hypothetical protein